MSEVAVPVPDSGKTEVGMRKNGTFISLYCCVLLCKANENRQELAHPQKTLPAHRRPQVLREATPRPTQHGSHEGAGKRNEG